MSKKIPKYIIRLPIIVLCFVFFYGIILLRLWHVQIRKGESHRERVENQSIRKIRIPAVRGKILSSDMHVLADNLPSYDVVFYLKDMKQPGKLSKTLDHILKTSEELCAMIGRKSTLTREGVLEHRRIYPALPMKIIPNLTPAEVSTIIEILPKIKGVEIVVNPVRQYPEADLACHLIGYSHPGDRKEAEDSDDFFYYIPDFVGKMGIELVFDSSVSTPRGKVKAMRGNPGYSIIRVNYLGFVHEVLGDTKEPENGNDIVLTIDYDAQRIAQELLKEELDKEGRNGAIVVLDADTGAVIAMASSPTFSPQDFIPKISSKKWNLLLRDKRNPLLNRATQGTYAPGSIVKPLVAMAVLEDNISYKEETDCRGSIYIGNARIRCWSWRRGGHGKINLVNALKQSCNVYFIEHGRKLGMEKVTAMMRSAGLGEKTGFDLPEKKGLIPKREDKRRIYGTGSWNEYDTALLSIGQGIILLTPLQAVVYVAAIANGGTVWRPYLLKEVRTPNGHVEYKTQPEKRGRLACSQRNLSIVQSGMWKVVNASDGTAKQARNDYIELSGKTGTAEVGPRGNRYTNTWFIGFGRYKHSRYSIVVFIERGASGGRTSAPIARKFFNRWLKQKEAR